MQKGFKSHKKSDFVLKFHVISLKISYGKAGNFM